MIAILDINSGNQNSIKNALDKIKIQSVITNDKSTIEKSNKIIIPGVGHFEKVIEKIKNKNLDKIIANHISNKKKILGICVGMQALMKFSEEGKKEGLNIINGICKKFLTKDDIRIPNIGWSMVHWDNTDLFKNIKKNSRFYFCHSYYCEINEKKIKLITTKYSHEYVCGFESNDLIYGIQFHPEKSHEQGLQLLKNFCDL